MFNLQSLRYTSYYNCAEYPEYKTKNASGSGGLCQFTQSARLDGGAVETKHALLIVSCLNAVVRQCPLNWLGSLFMGIKHIFPVCPWTHRQMFRIAHFSQVSVVPHLHLAFWAYAAKSSLLSHWVQSLLERGDWENEADVRLSLMSVKNENVHIFHQI